MAAEVGDKMTEVGKKGQVAKGQRNMLSTETLTCVHLRAKVMIFQNSKIPNGPN